MNPRLWGIIAFVFAISAAIAYHPAQRAWLAWGDIAFIAAVACLWLAARQTPQASTPAPPLRPIIRRRRHHAAILIGLACGLWLAQANMPGPDLSSVAVRLPYHLQIALLLSGGGLIIWGMMGGWCLRPPRRRGAPWGAYVLILWVAFGLRIAASDDLVHFFVDEGHFGEAVAHLAEAPNAQILTPLNAIAGFTWVYPYLQRLSADIAGPNLFALRLPSAFIGTLNVAALALLGAALGGRRLALAAMLALALYPPHIHFSRLALNNIADPLLLSGLLVCLLYSARRGAPKALVLGGLCLGLSPYFYEGGRLLLPALALVWTLGRRPWRGRALLWAAALGVAMPFLYVAARSDYVRLLPRLSLQGVGRSYIADLLTSPDGGAQLQAYIRDQLTPAYLHLVHAPDGSAFYYGGQTALILPLFVPLFALGVGVALARWRRGGLWPILWLALTVLGNSLLLENTWTARFVIALPPIALLLAWGWVGALDALGMRGPRRQWLNRVAVILYASASLVTYFGPHLALYNRQIRPFRDHQDAAFRAFDLPNAPYAFLLTTELVYAPHITMMARLRGEDIPLRILLPYQFPYEQAPDLLAERDIAFFLLPEDAETRQNLSRALGQPLDGPYWSPYHIPPDKQYALYWARRAEPSRSDR